MFLGIYFTAAKIDRVFASPFTRTMQTAHEICKQLNMKINIEAALSEEFLMDPYNTPVQPFEKLIKMYETANPNYRTHFDKGNVLAHIIQVYILGYIQSKRNFNVANVLSGATQFFQWKYCFSQLAVKFSLICFIFQLMYIYVNIN